jgi:hypothetical protein
MAFFTALYGDYKDSPGTIQAVACIAQSLEYYLFPVENVLGTMTDVELERTKEYFMSLKIAGKTAGKSSMGPEEKQTLHKAVMTWMVGIEEVYDSTNYPVGLRNYFRHKSFIMVYCLSSLTDPDPPQNWHNALQDSGNGFGTDAMSMGRSIFLKMDITRAVLCDYFTVSLFQRSIQKQVEKKQELLAVWYQFLDQKLDQKLDCERVKKHLDLTIMAPFGLAPTEFGSQEFSSQEFSSQEYYVWKATDFVAVKVDFFWSLKGDNLHIPQHSTKVIWGTINWADDANRKSSHSDDGQLVIWGNTYFEKLGPVSIDGQPTH